MNPALYVILSIGQLAVPYLAIVIVAKCILGRKRLAYAHSGY